MHQADEYVVFVSSALAHQMSSIESALDAVPERIRVAPLPDDPRFTLDVVVAWLRREYSLTERHSDVLVHLLPGWTELEIARELGIKVTTVKTHVKEIMRRTGQPNRMRLLELVFRYGPH
jgi:DNA-binding NarL/FixJ family response regulator